MTPHLTAEAQMAEHQPDTCAALLRAYLNEHTAFTLDDLAQQLRCTPHQLSQLWLCPRPGEEWETDIARIAQRVGCDRDVLAQLLRTALLEPPPALDLPPAGPDLLHPQVFVWEVIAPEAAAHTQTDFCSALWRASMMGSLSAPAGPARSR
jgi:hypothetical protein